MLNRCLVCGFSKPVCLIQKYGSAPAGNSGGVFGGKLGGTVFNTKYVPCYE